MAEENEAERGMVTHLNFYRWHKAQRGLDHQSVSDSTIPGPKRSWQDFRAGTHDPEMGRGAWHSHIWVKTLVLQSKLKD